MTILILKLKGTLMKTLKILIVILVTSCGLMSCSHKIQFNIQIQGKPELNSIKRFAIGEI